jgi:hypothetical protein
MVDTVDRMGMSESKNPDVFISYAHNDDNKIGGEDKGWVQQFHEDFDELLNEQLGRSPYTWKDSDITPNEDFEKKIFNRLVKAAVFLPIVSKTFINRPYCLQELREFAKNADRSDATYVDGEKKRIFAVEKREVDRGLLPPELRGLGTFKFYHSDGQPLRPALSSKDSPTRDDYYKALNRLSKTVADLLESMGREDPKHHDKPALQRSGLAVYVAETTAELEEARAALCDDLIDRGYVVLPDGELPRHISKYTAVVKGHLERAVLSVHLVGREYGFIPEGEKQLSNVGLQHRLALDASDKNPQFSQVVWLADPTECPADERQADFIEYLKTDERANVLSDLLEGNLERLKTELYAKLEHPRSPATVTGTELPGDRAIAASAPPLVYIICEQTDREAEQLKALRRHLYEQGCEPKLPMEGESDDKILKAHVEKLEQYDAFLIYYGNGSEKWLEAKLADFHKYLWNREKKMSAKAVYIAPPFIAAKHEFFTNEAPILRSGETFTAEAVAPFLTDLRRTAGR